MKLNTDDRFAFTIIFLCLAGSIATSQLAAHLPKKRDITIQIQPARTTQDHMRSFVRRAGLGKPIADQVDQLLGAQINEPR